jgi:hypothetical protein
MPEDFMKRIKKMSSIELDRELLSKEINDIGRHIILQEKTERQLRKPHWTVIPTFIIVLFTLVLTIMLNHESIFTVLVKIFVKVGR